MNSAVVIQFITIASNTMTAGLVDGTVSRYFGKTGAGIAVVKIYNIK